MESFMTHDEFTIGMNGVIIGADCIQISVQTTRDEILLSFYK